MRVAGSSSFNSGGTATVTIPGPQTGTRWIVERVAITTTSSQLTTAYEYVGDISLATNIVDSTDNGNLNASEYPQGLEVLAGETLSMLWVNGTPGASASVRWQFHVERPGG